jgi:hypothetical protein
MENQNQIIEALGKVPGLVEAAEKTLEACEEFKKMLADLLKRQIHANIPTEELNKVGSAAATAVAHTRCAMPDTTGLAQQIADKAISNMRPVIKAETELGVKDGMKDTPVVVKHEHSYYPTYEMTKVANEKLAQRFWIMLTITLVMALLSGLNAYRYFNSESHTGKAYMEIYRSKYATEAEQKMLGSEVYNTGFVPQEYYKSPEVVKAKIKRNKEILKQREAEAKANKGKFSTKVPLER